MLSRTVDFAKFLYLQRVKGFEPPTSPHLDGDTAARLTSLLSNASLYVEWGSGGSTVLAHSLKVETLTVESDAYYAKAVRSQLTDPTTVSILTPFIGITVEWGYPMFTNSTPRRLARWRDYIEAPFKALDDRFPDLLMVDGRFRIACALEAARRAQGRKSFMFIDDYPDRYRDIEEYLGTPEKVGRSALFELRDHTIPMHAVARYSADPT